MSSVKFEAILFDVNHTLIGLADEEETQARAVDVLFGLVKHLADDDLTRETFRDSYGSAWAAAKAASNAEYMEGSYEYVVDALLSDLGIRISTAELEEVLQAYMQPLYDAVYAIPGMLAILASLKGHVKLGAITNYKYANGMRGLLRDSRIGPLLDSVTISAEIGWKKPAPVIYEAALESLGVAANACVFVANELEKDLWQASSMGMCTVLFTPPEHDNHDAEFASILRERQMSDGERRPDFTVVSAEELGLVLADLVG